MRRATPAGRCGMPNLCQIPRLLCRRLGENARRHKFARTPEWRSAIPNLFDPLALGSLTMPNRLVMAPLTRGRADRDGVPGRHAPTYYAQRASAGLIISEATGISRDGLGWPFAPGLWTKEQVEGWKPVVGAVHEAGGRIVAQLWHMGRLVHPSLGGAQPVSASATIAPGSAHTYNGKQPYVVARALPVGEIKRIIDDYARAARNAIEAGFDGVQIHGANGYLVDQFLRSSANLRDDDYGGSLEHRMRFALEVIDAVGAAAGMDRTGIRLSPNISSQGIEDDNPRALFTALAKRLENVGIPWIELREPGPESTFGTGATARVSPAMRSHYSGAILLNSDFDAVRAGEAMAEGVADAISFGRPFIANPDLVDRVRGGRSLAVPDPKTFYSQGPEGYTDYPLAAEQRAA